MTRPLDKLLSLSYDSDLCFSLYQESKDPDLVIEMMSPLVRCVLLDQMKGLSEDSYQEYLSAGFEVLVDYIRNRRYQDDPPSADRFTNYFYTALRRVYLKTYWNIKLFVPDDGSECYQRTSRIPNYHDVENWIYIQQLPYEIYHGVECRIRFDGLEYEGCLYILDRILRYERVVPFVMKREYRIKDYQFFVRYVQVLIRMVLYELKAHRGNQYRYVDVL